MTLFWSPLTTMLILDTFSSIVSYTTNGTSRTSLYRFWTVTWIFSSNCLTSSFSFKDLLAFSSTSPFSFKSLFALTYALLLSFKDLSTFPLASLFSFTASSTCFYTTLFSCTAVAHCFCSSIFSSFSLSNSLNVISSRRHSSYVIPM
jgi:hypothetical protein